MLEIGLPRLIISRRFLQHLSRAVSRFSRGSVAGNHRQHLLFQSNWVKYDYSTIVHRIEKTVAWPLEKRDTALDRSWRKLRLILRRGSPISNIFGAKAHANVLKDTFSTNCKSNCMRIGLKMLGFSDTSVPPKHWWCR